MPWGLAGTAIAIGVVTAAWAWYAGVPVMYVISCLLAAVGVGLLVATHLTVAGNTARTTIGTGLVVVLTVTALLLPGWRPSSAAEHSTVWRVEVSDYDHALALPAGDALWVFDDSTIRAVERRTGAVRARINVPEWEEVLRTGWGIAVHLRDEDGTDSIAGYRPDGSRAWRFTDSKLGDLELRAARGGVTAVVACREWQDDRPSPKTCPATGLNADGERVWTRRVSVEDASTARGADARVLPSKQDGRWQLIDPKTGHNFAAPAPNLVRPWVTGDLTVFTQPGPGQTCHVVAYRKANRVWQKPMRGSACEDEPESQVRGWALYQRDTLASDDHSYLVDTRAKAVDELPNHLPGDWIGYAHGVLTSKKTDDHDAVYGTELATGHRRWSRGVGDAYAIGSLSGPVAVFRPEQHPVSGDNYSPDARIAMVYAAGTGRQVSSARVAEGRPDGMTSVSDGTVLLWYGDHVTYVAP